MGWEACSAVRPGIYKERLPSLPGDRTTRGRHSQSQLIPIVSQEGFRHAWSRGVCQDSGPGFPMDSAGSLFSILGPQKETMTGPSVGVVGPWTISFPLGFCVMRKLGEPASDWLCAGKSLTLALWTKCPDRQWLLLSME